MSDKPEKSGKLALPALPNLEKLKKEAKARLAAMRMRMPMARLADAQFLLARDYGFENWGALKAEVERRTGAPGADTLRANRARGALHRASQRTALDDEIDLQSPAPFFRAAMAATVCIIVVALVGVAIELVAGGHTGAVRLLAVVHRFVGHP